MTERVRPDWAGTERDQLNQVLEYQRATVHRKCAHLTDQQAWSTVLPNPQMTIANLVSHLIWCEHYWFESTLAGRPDEAPWTEEEPDGDWTDGANHGIADLLAHYERRCQSAREIITALEVDSVPLQPDMPPISVRATMLHMIEETARHLGHFDVIRELTDGATGE